jgi:hypothetical protein
MAETKQRHGCLTAWLVLMIISNSLTALIYLFAGGTIKSNLPNAPAWTLPILALASIANVVFSVALFRWKKWGFFGFVATSILAMIINLKLGMHVGLLLVGLLGVVTLYAVLQIGKDKEKGWTQLE